MFIASIFSDAQVYAIVAADLNDDDAESAEGMDNAALSTIGDLGEDNSGLSDRICSCVGFGLLFLFVAAVVFVVWLKSDPANMLWLTSKLGADVDGDALCGGGVWRSPARGFDQIQHEI